ncbi:hypothetical protein CHOED_056 [Vibrio phage CHOED]|uniref:hypothetical protein n=1 Tax=Vibrio phage CHOED TaxID=1458716 RepID=UPI00042F51BC|nr:hypothetical protein CHOED_056 [Vibrio phage CHOED]AHK11916.1 putative membrane protein [Vibrio phage CHOED]
MIGFLFLVCTVFVVLGFISLFEEPLGGIILLVIAWGIFMGTTGLQERLQDAQKTAEQVAIYKQQVTNLSGQVDKLVVKARTLEAALASSQEEVKAVKQSAQECKATRELTQDTVKGIQEILEN